jgi:hypothetical protein
MRIRPGDQISLHHRLIGAVLLQVPEHPVESHYPKALLGQVEIG